MKIDIENSKIVSAVHGRSAPFSTLTILFSLRAAERKAVRAA